MTIFQAFVLGVVQGLTEFLPISSSAHLILIPRFFKWQDPGLAFDVFLHMGTLVAVLGYFARDWWEIGKAGVASIIDRRIGFDRERLLFWLIFFGTIPAGVAGVLFHHEAESFFRDPILIAMPMALVGFLMYWVDGNYPALRSTDELSVKEAVYIGLAQACALVPGVSRSGATMSMGRLLGLNREGAARFSFLLSVPIIAAAGLFEFRKLTEHFDSLNDLNLLLTGFLASACVGLLTIHVLLRWLRVADFRFFAWYRVLLAAGIILWSVAPQWK